MEYVVISTDALHEMFITLYYNIGSIFSVALYLFVTVLGVYVVVEYIRYLAR